MLMKLPVGDVERPSRQPFTNAVLTLPLAKQALPAMKAAMPRCWRACPVWVTWTRPLWQSFVAADGLRNDRKRYCRVRLRDGQHIEIRTRYFTRISRWCPHPKGAARGDLERPLPRRREQSVTSRADRLDLLRWGRRTSVSESQ